MSDAIHDPDAGWQWCTFEGAELHTLLLGLQSSFREKLEWLEEMEELSMRLRRSREVLHSGDRATDPDPSSDRASLDRSGEQAGFPAMK
jgi:hypothetical protein